MSDETPNDEGLNAPDASVTQLPVRLDLDLDTYERPEADVIEPFVVRLGGRTITMTDPAEVAWQDLLNITNPVHFLKYTVKPEDRNYIIGLELPAWKLEKLMNAFQTHFRIDEKLEKVQRAERLQSI